MYQELVHGDPGLQPERTILAWNRTTVSLAVSSAILLRWSGVYGWAILIPVVGLLILAAAILLTQRMRYRRQATGLGANSIRANIGGVIALTASSMILGGCGLYFVIVH